jgi:signal transduction histidine kinase
VASANQQRRQMTADIAHDLRTPLTVIAGYVESMRDGILKPTPERLTVIYTEIERLQQMVTDLRMLSQADAGELHLNPQPVVPRQLVERAAELFQHHAERQNVQLALKIEENLPEIEVDESRLMQVMDNLISNALHYTPESGRITLGAKKKEDTVELTIQDTGSGIPAEEIPLIFNRFHRVEKSRHAESGESGLGLAIVKALVEANGGQIWAESEEGKGTTMHVAFPAIG